MAIKVHLSKTRPGPFGGTLLTTTCGRLRVLADGMNLTTEAAKVTCSFCLKRMKFQQRAA